MIQKLIPELNDESSIEFGDNVVCYPHSGRVPTEPPILEVHYEEPISFQYTHRGVETDERRWVFIFELKDVTDTVRDDRDGVVASLHSIYTYNDEEISTKAVNGGTMVPEEVVDLVRKYPDVDHIGRPPYLPARDGDTDD